MSQMYLMNFSYNSNKAELKDQIDYYDVTGIRTTSNYTK